MLQLRCSNCNEVVTSQLLAEVSVIECGQCKVNVPVQDVFIKTQHFTINREVFLDQANRFRRLLRDVEKDLLLMANDKEASIKSIESLEQLHSSLHELLDGTRDSYRVEIPRDLYVEVTALNKILRGKLLNLSAAGCAIEIVMVDTIPRKNSEPIVEFFFPGLSELLKTQAKVVWVNEQTQDNGSQYAIVGVTFIDMDENTRNCIWNYIIDNAPAPFQRVSR